MSITKHLTNREWVNILQNDFKEKYFRELEKFIQQNKKTLCPREELIFRALNLTSYNNTKIVILGQDPFHTPNIANGLAFSSNEVPPSLKNIFKEMKSDLNINNNTGDLTSYANQGVLLLNRVLTTKVGEALSHEDKGWEQFTDKVITALDNRASPVIFLLWGKRAQEVVPLIKGKHHYMLTAGHPSPFSVKLFQNCKHFSKANEILKSINKKPITWQL